MPHLERTQVDANVCAFLATADSDFDAESELEILKDRTRIAQWEAELRRRDVIRAEEIANDPIPGVNTHPIGLVGARMSQGIANNPTISTRQALVDAAHGVLIPGAVDLVMGGSSTATTSTSSPFGRASRASDATAPTTDNKAVFIADMLGNINLAAGPSSSSATDGGVADQTLLSGTEGKDEACKLSKSKRKRDRAKRAKAARAKEAAENAGNAVINDDGDNDGDAPDLADG